LNCLCQIRRPRDPSPNFVGIGNKPVRGEIREILLDDLEPLGNFFRDHIKDSNGMTATGKDDRPPAPDQARSDNCNRFVHIMLFAANENGQAATMMSRRGCGRRAKYWRKPPLHCSDDQGQSCYRRLPVWAASAATELT